MFTGKPEARSLMECCRCGTCCMKFQAIVDHEELQKIADHLAITSDEWIDRYAETRWPGHRNFLMRHTGNGCIFLRDEGDITRCDIHAVRPSCCSDWQPSPDNVECREGLERKRG